MDDKPRALCRQAKTGLKGADKVIWHITFKLDGEEKLAIFYPFQKTTGIKMVIMDRTYQVANHNVTVRFYIEPNYYGNCEIICHYEVIQRRLIINGNKES